MDVNERIVGVVSEYLHAHRFQRDRHSHRMARDLLKLIAEVEAGKWSPPTPEQVEARLAEARRQRERHRFGHQAELKR